MVGSGIDSNGNNQAFLLSYTPDTVFDPQPIFIPSIPEPENYAMLLAGLGVIGFMTWRRKESVETFENQVSKIKHLKVQSCFFV